MWSRTAPKPTDPIRRSNMSEQIPPALAATGDEELAFRKGRDLSAQHARRIAVRWTAIDLQHKCRDGRHIVQRRIADDNRRLCSLAGHSTP